MNHRTCKAHEKVEAQASFVEGVRKVREMLKDDAIKYFLNGQDDSARVIRNAYFASETIEISANMVLSKTSAEHDKLIADIESGKV